MNVIDKRWKVLGGCGYVVQYWVECVALLPLIQGMICLLKKRQFLVYSAAFMYSSPLPSKSSGDNLNSYGVLYFWEGFREAKGIGFVCVLRYDSAFSGLAAAPFTGEVREARLPALLEDLPCSAFHSHRTPFLHATHLKTPHGQRTASVVKLQNSVEKEFGTGSLIQRGQPKCTADVQKAQTLS